jgi:hypothetical protein
MNNQLFLFAKRLLRGGKGIPATQRAGGAPDLYLSYFLFEFIFYKLF